MALLDELGLETYPRYREGASLYVDARRSAPRGSPARTSRSARDTAIAIEQLTKTLDDLAADLDPDRPWEHPEAERLDRITFQQWLEGQTDDVEARDNIALYVGPAMLTKPAWAFSALQAVLMAASAGSFRHLVDADFILDRRVEGGLASVPLELAERLGDRVRLEQDVTAVEYDDQGATVVVGRRAAASPTGDPRGAAARWSGGSGSRRSCRRPPPRARAPVLRSGDQGAGGVPDPVLAGPGPQRHRLRALPARARGLRQHSRRLRDRSPGRLRLRRGGRPGRSPVRTGSARGRCCASLVAYFGEAARTPSTYVESDWQHQELTGGAYGTSFDVGGLTRYGHVLREPVGPDRVRHQRRRRPRLPARRRRGPHRHRARPTRSSPSECSLQEKHHDQEHHRRRAVRGAGRPGQRGHRPLDRKVLRRRRPLRRRRTSTPPTRRRPPRFRTWRRTTPAERQRALMALADALEARTEDLVAAEVENTGKPVELTRSEEITVGIDQLASSPVRLGRSRARPRGSTSQATPPTSGASRWASSVRWRPGTTRS